MACLILMCLFLTQACKKDLFLPKDKSPDKNKQITNIGYQTFLSSIDINKTGSLKTVLSKSREKIMSTEKTATNLTLQTDSVIRLVVDDTISYILALKPQTPRAVQFQNITIQITKDKTIAFLSTYYPDKEWVEDWRKDRHMGFKGTITFNKINLEERVTSSIKQDVVGRGTDLKSRIIASIGNADMKVSGMISLAPGECEIYDVYTVVPYPCSTGDWPGHCAWESDGGLTMEMLDYLPGYRVDKNTVVNCAMPQLPGGGSGGGGGNTSPNPGGSYDPCNGTPQPVPPGGISFERATRLMVAAPTDCDPSAPGDPTVPNVTSRQFLLDNFDLTTEERNYINDPTQDRIVNALANYALQASNKNFTLKIIQQNSLLSNVAREKIVDALLADIPSIHSFLEQNEYVQALEAYNEFQRIDSDMNNPSYDFLDGGWLQSMLETERIIRTLSTLPAKMLAMAIRLEMEQKAQRALTRTALTIYPQILDNQAEYQKQAQFNTNAEHSVAIMLLEFATGTGLNSRNFGLSQPITQKYLEAGNKQRLINEFYAKLATNSLTYNDFKSENSRLAGRMDYSPDHAGVASSFQHHINSDLSRFFISGADVFYYPTSEDGWVEVEVYNETTVRSLFLHMGVNYPRTMTSGNRPLSTIKQYYKFRLKIN